ncbi:MAG: efflux RND transporter periplasmic adaptor subunit [Propionibacteriaceae bacterium]|nr:efflux RND transporter periplasmic adaptor subunit [Propionibacteriaceae bacterium]
MLALALILLAGGGVAVYNALQPAETEEVPFTLTRTATVERTTLSETVGLDGTLVPATQAELNFAVSGTVTKVYVKVGDVVEKDDKLAKIDDADLQDAVEMAEANLTSAKADYSDALDDGTSAQKKSAKAQVESAKAALATAKSNLKSAVLRSTIAGTVAEVNINKGDSIGGSNSSMDTSSSAAFLVLDPKAWQVEGTVSSADIANVKAGQKATVTIGESQEPVEGEVATVGIVASSSMDGQATFPVTVKLTAENDKLYSGTTATATITTSETPDVLAVATAAVQADGEQMYVTKADGTKVDITIGKTLGDLTEVTSGLSEGDEVQITMNIPMSTEAATDGEFGGGMGMGGMGVGGGTVVVQGGGGGPAMSRPQRMGG